MQGRAPLGIAVQPRGIQTYWEQALWVCDNLMRLGGTIITPAVAERHREFYLSQVTQLGRGHAGI